MGALRLAPVVAGGVWHVALPLGYYNEGNHNADHDDHQHNERGLNSVGHHDTSPAVEQAHASTTSTRAELRTQSRLWGGSPRVAGSSWRVAVMSAYSRGVNNR